MRMELRVCQHCYDGEHGNPDKTDVTRDMVNCAEQLREFKDLLPAGDEEGAGLEAVYINRVTEGDPGGAEAMPVYKASIQNNQVQLRDTQLVMEDMDGNTFVYTEPDDILKVLTRNLAQIQNRTRQDVSVELTETGEKLVSNDEGGPY